MDYKKNLICVLVLEFLQQYIDSEFLTPVTKPQAAISGYFYPLMSTHTLQILERWKDVF